MRMLKLKFPKNSVEKLDQFLKNVKTARLFRRGQAVREVVKGKSITEVSHTFKFAYSALYKWVHRFGRLGVAGLKDLPRQGRPRKVTPEVERNIRRLFQENDKTQSKSFFCHTCAQRLHIIEERVGVCISRETLRRILKKSQL